jgi:murein DD-endopeptidase MepM/ murein hydrolase activator NlpD
MRAVPTGVSADLRLCAGMGVSNAPAADSRGRIVNFEPVANVHGVVLTRAPVDACVSSGFGPRRGRGGRGSTHEGVDLYTRSPAPIYAAGDGVVESVATLNGYGRTVLIRHNGRVKTRYAHLSEYAPSLRRGARVRRGEVLGQTGRTGNATAVHLHYEILVDGRPQNPLTVGGRFTAAPGS